MGKFIIIMQMDDVINSIMADDGIIHEIDIDFLLGDFLELSSISELEARYLLSVHPFTAVDTRLNLRRKELKDEICQGLCLLDVLVEMVQQNEENVDEIFSSILEAHDIELTYRFTNLNNDEALHDVPFKLLRKYLDEDFRLSYPCKKIPQMVAAVFHYYIARQYSFVKCLHCGRYYANHHKKVLYCDRISPYVDKYSQKKDGALKTCPDAVKAARKQLRRRVNRIYRIIESKPKYQTQEDKALVSLFGEFSKTAGRYLDLMECESSVKVLTEFNDYLEKIEMLEELRK